METSRIFNGFDDAQNCLNAVRDEPRALIALFTAETQNSDKNRHKRAGKASTAP